MKAQSKKNIVHDLYAYPHIGQFLGQYFAKNGVNRAEVSRQVGVAESTSTTYVRRDSLQFRILWKISVALKHNFLADLALQLPIAFTTPREKDLEMQLEALQQQLNELKIENKTYKNLLLNRSIPTGLEL